MLKFISIDKLYILTLSELDNTITATGREKLHGWLAESRAAQRHYKKMQDWVAWVEKEKKPTKEVLSDFILLVKRRYERRLKFWTSLGHFGIVSLLVLLYLISRK